MKGKILLSTILASAFLFVGCSDKSSDEAKAYDLKMALDKGDYDYVIRELGNCESESKTTAQKTSCYNALSSDEILDLGSAYFGKAGFDMISLGSDLIGIDDDLSDDDKSKEVTSIILRKLDNDNMKYGINAYKRLLPNSDDSICTEANYDNLTDLQKQACVSMNPILLKDLVQNEDKTADEESTAAVSLEDIIAFKDVLKDAAPGIEIEDIVDIMNDDITAGTASEKDVNANGNLDNLEATSCSVSAVNNGDLTACASDSVTITVIDQDTNDTFSEYTGTVDLSGVILVKNVIASSSASYSDATKYRLIQEIGSTGVYTNLTQESGKYCDNTATEATSCTALDETSCFPCPLIEEGEVKTLNDTVTTILNDDDLLTSIAVSSDSENDSLTDAEKVAKLKTEMCGLEPGEDDNKTNWISNSNCSDSTFTGTLQAPTSGTCSCVSSELTISQDGLLDYMSREN